MADVSNRAELIEEAFEAVLKRMTKIATDDTLHPTSIEPMANALHALVAADAEFVHHHVCASCRGLDDSDYINDEPSDN